MMNNTGRTVLVIDDDADVFESLRLFLENKGYRVIGAPNGVEGMKTAKSEKPDVIILDVLMQKKDGLTTYGELRGDGALKEIPVIMLTSVHEKLGFGVSPGDMESHYGVPPEGFLEKPFDPPKLLDLIEKLTGS